ncbi:MAG: hypothetical protein GY913_20665 [Proteobacteria bacterium]|nr:hypothetical protein [Pseudomonadota bacterium]MCP4919321.1 hypothetical protein [Pseudomonadota bacterium]
MSVRNERLLLACLLLAAVALMLRPIAADPLGLAIGAVRSEGPRHFWGLWGTAEHLGEWGPFVAHLELDHPTGYTRHLMDPINLVFFLPAHTLVGGVAGATLGYNLVHVGWTLIGGFGTWLLARRLVGPGLPALFAAFAVATTPYLLATPYLGRTEFLPGMGLALHWYLLMRALDADARWWHGLAAGLSIAAIALGGWYLAAWLLLLEPPVALALASRSKGTTWTRRMVVLTGVGVVALLPVLPALFALLEYPPPIMGEEQRVSEHMGICTPPQLLLPFSGEQGLPGADLAAYPGTVLLITGIAGAIRHKAARPWLGLAVALLVLSLGPFLVWTQEPSELMTDPIRLPAWWVEDLIPPLRFIWGWCRLGIWVTLPLALSGGYALRELFQRFPTLHVQFFVLLLMGVAIDHGADRRPAGVHGGAFDPRPPPELMTALETAPEGAVLQLPLDDFYMVWQLAHGRPISESQEIEDVRASSWVVQQALEVIDQVKAGDPPERADFGRGIRGCGSWDENRLVEAGYGAVVLHRDRLPDAHVQLSWLLGAALGPPDVDTANMAVWTPEPQSVPSWLECPLAEVDTTDELAGPTDPP